MRDRLEVLLDLAVDLQCAIEDLLDELEDYAREDVVKRAEDIIKGSDGSQK